MPRLASCPNIVWLLLALFWLFHPKIPEKRLFILLIVIDIWSLLWNHRILLFIAFYILYRQYYLLFLHFYSIFYIFLYTSCLSFLFRFLFLYMFYSIYLVCKSFLCVFHNNYYKVKDELMKWGKRLISFFSCLYTNIFVKLFPCEKSKFTKINLYLYYFFY